MDDAVENVRERLYGYRRKEASAEEDPKDLRMRFLGGTEPCRRCGGPTSFQAIKRIGEANYTLWHCLRCGSETVQELPGYREASADRDGLCSRCGSLTDIDDFVDPKERKRVRSMTCLACGNVTVQDRPY